MQASLSKGGKRPNGEFSDRIGSVRGKGIKNLFCFGLLVQLMCVQCLKV